MSKRLTPLMVDVLVAVHSIETDDRARAKRSGVRTFVWFGAAPKTIATRVKAAVSSPITALINRGLLARAPMYDRSASRNTTRYVLTPEGRRILDARLTRG